MQISYWWVWSIPTRTERFIISNANAARTSTAKLEVDNQSDTWMYHDPIYHGDILNLRSMRDPVYRDGYVMSHYDRRPYELGCLILRHKPKA
jgi:hypothetical protein